MTISYPISLPASPAPRVIRPKARDIVGATISPFTAQQFLYQHEGQAWAYDLVYPPMQRPAFAALKAAWLSLDGIFGTLLFGDPVSASPRGTPSGTPLVDGAGQTGQTLNTKGWTAASSGNLLAGDHLQIAAGAAARVYSVLDSSVDADGGGLASISIWPRLRESPGDGAAIITADTVGLFRRVSNVLEWDEDLGPVFGVSIAIVEAL